MKKIILVVTFIISLTLFGCDVNLIPNKDLLEGYYIEYAKVDLDLIVEIKNIKSISSIIESCVSEVGYNKDFIIIKHHPTFEEDSYHLYQINYNITNFYIIPIKKKISDSVNKNIIGPMTKEDFLKKRKELKVPDELKFSLFPTKWNLICFWEWW